MNETKKTSLHPRRLARSVARAQLQKAGVTGFNKSMKLPNGMRIPSMFSANWRNTAARAVTASPKKKKRKDEKHGNRKA